MMKIMCLKNTKNAAASGKSAFLHFVTSENTTFSMKKKRLVVKRPFSFFFLQNFVKKRPSRFRG